jgi:hypothetical protein
MKDDAMAQLSDRAIALTARMQDIEKKQSLIMLLNFYMQHSLNPK